MKNKLKKMGVLAVLLANVAIFAPQKAEGQGKQQGGGGCTSMLIDCKGIGTGDKLVCVKGGDIKYGCDCGSMSPCFG
ncbi:MAG: hypothetical protein SFU27_03295 [Thermonemataceae bacterium]|nr:hypothetical protein [Thermonemataceae bacterium]